MHYNTITIIQYKKLAQTLAFPSIVRKDSAQRRKMNIAPVFRQKSSCFPELTVEQTKAMKAEEENNVEANFIRARFNRLQSISATWKLPFELENTLGFSSRKFFINLGTINKFK